MQHLLISKLAMTMQTSRKVLVALLAPLLLGACVQTSATMLSSKTFPPLSPEEVTIYVSEEDIPAEYEKVAIINATGSSSYTNEAQLYEAVRKRAAKIGANGVLLSEIKEPGTGAKVAAAVFGYDTQRKSQMIAIYVHH